MTFGSASEFSWTGTADITVADLSYDFVNDLEPHTESFTALDFDIERQDGFIMNPCEIIVPEFEPVTFAKDTATITNMETLKQSSTEVYYRDKCADGAYPSMNYQLKLGDVEDTSQGCGNEIYIGDGSGGLTLNDYVFV